MAYTIEQQQAIAIANARRRQAEATGGQPPATGTAGSPLRAFAYGLSPIPFATSAIGAGIAKMAGAEQPLSELYRQAQADTVATQEANPWSSLAGNVTGIAGTLPLASTKLLMGATRPIEGIRGAINAIPEGLSAIGNFIRGGEVAKDAGLLTKATALGGKALRSSAVSAPMVGANFAESAPEGQGGEAFLKGMGVGGVVGAALPVVAPVAKSLGRLVTSPVQESTRLIRGLDTATENVAGGISKRISRTDIPKELQALPDAELAFVKSLTDEGVSIPEALASMAESKAMGVSPSVSVTANIPQMQRKAYMTSQASSGSKVAAEAIKDIEKIQIPKLNETLVKTATGGKSLSAEEYGGVVFKGAKDLVTKKETMLKTRAKPYYEASIGLDKSIPIEAKEMKNVLKNPLATKALEDFRTDSFTLTNVKKDMEALGIDATDLEKLPYNSTVALHAARSHLRQLGDTAFRAGEKQKYGAIKSALGDIDTAIESQYPAYGTARKIYSEDAGALKALRDSAVGKMATMAEGDFSKISNDLMSKDPAYINKFIAKIGDNQKMKDSIAGAFLKRQLEESAFDGRRFSQNVFKNEGNRNRLKAIVGEDRFIQIEKINNVIDQLLQTKNLKSGSQTAANIATRDTGFTLKEGVFEAVRKKITPNLFDTVLKDPTQSKRFNELLFTDEGYKLLDSLSKNVKPTAKDIGKVGEFMNKAKEYIKDESGNIGKKDYMISHRPPTKESGAPAFDLTGDGNIYPDDVYSSKAVQYYGTGNPAMDRKTFQILHNLKGKPDAKVTIYRASEKGVPKKINDGDWVTVNPEYAKEHGGRFEKGYQIIKKDVKASEIFTNGDSIHEFGYYSGKKNIDFSNPKSQLGIASASGTGMLLTNDGNK